MNFSGHMVCVYSDLVDNATFPNGFTSFYFYHLGKGSSCSASLPTLDNCHLFPFSHAGECVVVIHYHFHLHSLESHQFYLSRQE